MSFESDLAAFIKQPAIQKQIKMHVKKYGVPGGPGGTGGHIEAEVMKYAMEAVNYIIASLPESLKSGSSRPITTADLVIGPIATDANGDFEVTLRWNPDAIHRDSLYLDGYPDGVEDIVELFSKGTKPLSHWVAGAHKSRFSSYYYWYYIPEGWKRNAGPFIKDAVTDFNAKYGRDNVRLYAPDKYY